MGFDDVCKDLSHTAVHYDEYNYMKCDLDKKYVYGSGRGRTLTFSKPKDRRHYELTKRRLKAIFGNSRV